MRIRVKDVNIIMCVVHTQEKSHVKEEKKKNKGNVNFSVFKKSKHNKRTNKI